MKEKEHDHAIEALHTLAKQIEGIGLFNDERLFDDNAKINPSVFRKLMEYRMLALSDLIHCGDVY